MENADNNKKETKSVENSERAENVEKWLAIRNEWERRAKTETKTITDLTNLATDIWNHVISLKDGEDIYNDSSSAASSLALAGIYMCSYNFGLTFFQMHYIMWTIIDKMMIDEHDVGLRIVNFNNMLYPQYEYLFNKTMSKDEFDALQKKAASMLKIGNLGKEVEEHLKSIVAGNVPFGWKVDESRKR